MLDKQTMTDSVAPSDEELLQRMNAGDEDAFTLLYRRRQGAVYRFALQMSGSATVAEDVTQEVFLVLIREPQSYDPCRGSLSAYLYGIARNHVLRQQGQGRPHDPITEDEGEADTHVPDRLIAPDNPLGDLARHEEIESVRQAIQALAPHYREVVLLCDIHELSYAEAAGVLGCPVGTVRSRLHRAHALLIGKLRAETRRGTASSKVNVTRCFA
jgi:RNA polymerase sigma-70 factor (ECF subfamily)